MVKKTLGKPVTVRKLFKNAINTNAAKQSIVAQFVWILEQKE